MAEAQVLVKVVAELVTDPGELDTVRPFAIAFYECPELLQAVLRHFSITPASARLCAKLWLSKDAFLVFVQKLAPWCPGKELNIWAKALKGLFERVVPHSKWSQRDYNVRILEDKFVKDAELSRRPSIPLVELTLKSIKDWAKWSPGEVASLGDCQTSREVERQLERRWRQFALDLLLPFFDCCPNFVKVGRDEKELHDLFGALRFVTLQKLGRGLNDAKRVSSDPVWFPVTESSLRQILNDMRALSAG